MTNFYLFDLFCHLGTTAACVIFLRKEIIKIFKEKSKISIFIIAVLPLIPSYFLLKPLINYFSNSRFLPIFILSTSIILFIASGIKPKENSSGCDKKKIKDVLIIGCAQALALIPGLSRCGWTISSACLRGWKIQEAVKFSFLLSIPTILGGTVLESFALVIKNQSGHSLSFSYNLTGFFTSFVVGYFAIRYIFSIDSFKKLKPFAWYMLLLAFASFIYLNYVHI